MTKKYLADGLVKAYLRYIVTLHEWTISYIVKIQLLRTRDILEI